MRKAVGVLIVAVAFFASVPTISAQTGRLWNAPRAGVWTVTAEDEEGVNWSGRLYLASSSARGRRVGYRGYFYWISGDRSTKGNEYFTGSFDRSSGKLKLHGYKVRNMTGELGTGDYRASAIKGRKFVRGSWGGGNSVPGTWTARWKNAR